MNWPAISGHLWKLGAPVACALLLHWPLRVAGFYDVTAHEREGLNTLILLLGSIYAVIFAFVIFVIWGQFTEVENSVMNECNSLNDLLRFGRFLNPDASRSIRRGLNDYARSVLNSEWQLLTVRKRDPETERTFAILLSAVMNIVPTQPAEDKVHSRLIDVLRRVGEQRDQRITKSLSRIPPTLFHFVNTIALAILLLVFVYPFHYPATSIFAFLLVAVVLFLASVVMTDTDNPFDGLCNVSSQPFTDLLS